MAKKYGIYLFIAIALLLVLFIVSLNYAKIKALFTAKKTTPDGNTLGAKAKTGNGYSGYTATNLDGTTPLKIGSTGKEVTELQTILNNWIGSNPITIDGNFGQQTEDSLFKNWGVKVITLNDAWKKQLYPFMSLTGTPATTDTGTTTDTSNNNWFTDLLTGI